MHQQIGLQACGMFLALILFAVVTGQEKPAEGLTNEAAAIILGGNADRWLHELIDSTDYIDSSITVNRLSFFRLSPAQLAILTEASDQEESRDKRVQLWHAMRQSRDAKTRDYLIQVLLEAGVEMQIQFLDEWDSPGRFDVPLLIALYKSQPSRPKVIATSNTRTHDFGDLFDVRRKIVELACHVQWEGQMIGWPYPGEKAAEQIKAKHLESSNLRDTEAGLAQEQFVNWLIRNGHEDDHRISAYRLAMYHGSFWKSRKNQSALASSFLKGLRSPEGRAKAIRLVMPSIDPRTFLTAKEAEVVRLSAIDAMHAKVIHSYLDAGLRDFQGTLAVYKTILAESQKSDPSPKVKMAAERCLDRIAYCEQHLKELMKAFTRDSAQSAGP